MKRLIHLFTLACILCIGQYSYSQQRDPGRKIIALHKQESLVHSLPFSQEYITNTVVVEIQQQRALLAPHYPDTTNLQKNTQEYDQAFNNWFNDYPAELTDYYTYLSNYIRNNKADQ